MEGHREVGTSSSNGIGLSTLAHTHNLRPRRRKRITEREDKVEPPRKPAFVLREYDSDRTSNKAANLASVKEVNPTDARNGLLEMLEAENTGEQSLPKLQYVTPTHDINHPQGSDYPALLLLPNPQNMESHFDNVDETDAALFQGLPQVERLIKKEIKNEPGTTNSFRTATPKVPKLAAARQNTPQVERLIKKEIKNEPGTTNSSHTATPEHFASNMGGILGGLGAISGGDDCASNNKCDSNNDNCESNGDCDSSDGYDRSNDYDRCSDCDSCSNSSYGDDRDDSDYGGERNMFLRVRCKNE
ncbi:hypothetical protein TrCOL_g6073 [Triparma columacea]|uniref:Uncharacterized protein n=1 Tax=Triparma columacea TaxID=722753 RepID=A0A9W7L5N6_9STRA|nr:hypothetical protein TrCOL_g6073 [Triparma columacea]